MSFPDDVLAADEQVVLHLHPHVKTVVRPVLVLAVTVAVFVVAWVMLPTDSGGRLGVWVIGVAALVTALRRAGWPLLVWRCTHYVFTDERILLQDGVLSRQRRDLPLLRVNDHVMRQTVLDRVLGCGTLTVDSIGEQVAVLAAVPRVQEVQTTLYELVDQARVGSDDDGYDEDPDDELDDDDFDEPELPVQPVRRGLFRSRRG